MNFLSADSPEDQELLLTLWSDAPVENELLCSMILDVAREQVIAYASETEEDPDFTWTNPPQRFVYAQLQQAKNLWNAGRANSDGNVGPDYQPQFTFQPRPLDKTIRSIIRPTSGAASVF